MKFQRSVALCAVIGAVMGLSACATVTRGTKTAWEVTSTPPGARVQTSNGFTCAQTPCSIKMPRKSSFVATLSLRGYQNATVTVTNQVVTEGGVAMAGNVLIGGLIGVGVDASTGAMLDLTPNPAHIDMTPFYRTAPAFYGTAPAAPPVEIAALGSNLGTRYSDYVDEVTVQVQGEMRSLLTAQSEQLPERYRAGFASSFDRSVEGSSSFIRGRVIRTLGANATPDERNSPEIISADRMLDLRRQVDQSRRAMSATLVRSAWVRACGEAGASVAQDCAIYLSTVERDLSRFEGAEPQA
jgi:hypothetical protein